MNGQQTLRKVQQAVSALPAGAGKDLLESVLREAKANVSANKMKGKKRKTLGTLSAMWLRANESQFCCRMTWML